MSTTKRLRRHARASGRYLTDAQYAQLAFGWDIPGGGFASEEQEQAAWKIHRNDLMREESAPGIRPIAFFKFDLGETPARWFDQIKLLVDHKQIDAAEALSIERNISSLGPKHPPEAWQSLRSGLRLDSAATYAREFDVTAAWHRWRGRPDVAERWEQLAAIARDQVKRGDR